MTNSKAGPVEVWLSQQNLAINCTVVHEDESTDALDIESLSMRGAQREITGYFIGRGYKPDGRWEATAADRGDVLESMRRFRAPAETAS